MSTAEPADSKGGGGSGAHGAASHGDGPQVPPLPATFSLLHPQQTPPDSPHVPTFLLAPFGKDSQPPSPLSLAWGGINGHATHQARWSEPLATGSSSSSADEATTPRHHAAVVLPGGGQATLTEAVVNGATIASWMLLSGLLVMYNKWVVRRCVRGGRGAGVAAAVGDTCSRRWCACCACVRVLGCWVVADRDGMPSCRGMRLQVGRTTGAVRMVALTVRTNLRGLTSPTSLGRQPCHRGGRCHVVRPPAAVAGKESTTPAPPCRSSDCAPPTRAAVRRLPPVRRPCWHRRPAVPPQHHT